MKDKNGLEIKIGDKIISKGKFQYDVFLNKNYPETGLWAKGKNLHHTGPLSGFDSNQIEIAAK
jgi:hypothetical protein